MLDLWQITGIDHKPESLSVVLVKAGLLSINPWSYTNLNPSFESWFLSQKLYLNHLILSFYLLHYNCILVSVLILFWLRYTVCFWTSTGVDVFCLSYKTHCVASSMKCAILLHNMHFEEKPFLFGQKSVRLNFLKNISSAVRC